MVILRSDKRKGIRKLRRSLKGLVDAVTINGLLSPVERSEALVRVSSGLATIIYISPEQLRSRTIERLYFSSSLIL